ncbi:MAG TPA: 30S ribosomal protein S19e [Candidatus Aenigmarchaeota archaeon]|nr:30S ribosomal protein S19e [Candidatus Aenigmarchaeota archaeon]
MFTPYDVPPSILIKKMASKLKEISQIQMPEWAKFVKTGIHRERIPSQSDWWYLRAASILYQVYMRGPIGLGHLRKLYGGRKRRGPKPEKKVNAAGKIIRSILQQLEVAGLVVKTINGRKISPKGQRLLNQIATEIAKELNLSS